MGVKGKSIVNLDVDELVVVLNKALAEEWLAYYQYWIGTKVMEGPMRGEVIPELMLHATQELNHATLVCNRIIQLGGTPIIDPREWFNAAECEYAAPSDPYIEEILKQNIEGERCAIARYDGLVKMTEGKDEITNQLAKQILAEELEHEQDLEDFVNDLQRLKEDLMKFRG